MEIVRILPEAPGLRPVACDAPSPTNPMPIPAPRPASPSVIEPLISASSDNVSNILFYYLVCICFGAAH